MDANDQLVTLRCPHCNYRSVCDRLRVGERLREIGMLKRDASPNWTFLVALLESAAESMTCSECQRSGLLVTKLEAADDQAWGLSRKCLGCNQPIPPERLEVFPDTEFCPTCQASEERGEAPGTDVEYCSQCGDILTVARAPGSGVARYIIRCPNCGKR